MPIRNGYLLRLLFTGGTEEVQRRVRVQRENGNTARRLWYEWQLGKKRDLGDTTNERNLCFNEHIHQQTCFHFTDQETKKKSRKQGDEQRKTPVVGDK
jgi:hypothetical protein